MTQDFKDKVLKYLTGNIEEDSGINEPQFGTVETITNNLYQYMLNEFDVQGQTLPYIIDIIKSNQNDTYLCYGNGYNFGFMIILDSNFQVIESTKEYSSGTTMQRFYILKQGNDGRFYGVDYTTGEGSLDEPKRFIILNNILLKSSEQSTYQYIMRRTFNFPAAYNTIRGFSTVNDVIKNENGGQYLICGNYLNSNNDYNVITLELVINVGAANEWNEYKQNVEDGKIYAYNGAWASWNSEGTISILATCNVTNTIYLLEKNGNALTTKATYTISSNPKDFVMKTIILNDTTMYSLVTYYNNQNDDGITYIYMIKNGQISLLYQSPTYTTIVGNVLTWGLKTDYINTYFWYATQNGANYSYYGGLIAGEKAYATLIKTVDDIYPLTLQLSFNQYNLYTFTLQSANNLYKIPFVFNQFNYNGLPYEDINCIKPNSGILYDNNDNIIFARNLYNLNINGNTTISTIEVPNTFLNDTTIAREDLLSETNIVLNDNVQNISKNIYEVLDINFFNTLVMKNSNNPLNEIINNPGASRLNGSLSQMLDYSNVYAHKIRINYSDNTNRVETVSIPTITNGVATYIFSIYVSKAISNIEIISNDENTSYQTINGTFNIGSTYTITQDVRVE